MTETTMDGRPAASGVTLRAATAGDLDPMQELLRTADLPVDGVTDQFPEGYVVAVADGRVIGAAGIEVHDGHGLLRSVVVTPACGGAGVGAALVRDRIAWAAGRRLHGVALLTTTAAAFFERLGFRADDRAAAPAAIRASQEFAALCPASATYMTLELRRAPA